MPSLITLANSRLQEVAQDEYAIGDWEAQQSLLWSNSDKWRGEGELIGGQDWDVPETAFVFPYAAPLPAQQAILDQLTRRRGRVPEEDEAVTVTWSATSGNIASRLDSARQDVISRVLTYRGRREGRLAFGTRIFDALTHNVTDSLLREVERVTRVALLAAADRYALDSLAATLQGRTIHLAIVVTVPLETGEQRQIFIDVDLS